ncbi:lysozyme inhibitor LprI family protein [Dokdonella sp.]|uniref:lysozyme inhibitor LprI family protein n=1 Tax=Dokdonella sp. TaxID=2291710 RepID=UPI0037830860
MSGLSPPMRKAAAVALSLATGTATAASFDCGKATTRIEHAVCANTRLSQLDEQLAQAYRSAVGSAQAGSIRQTQRDWMRTRDACASDACLEREYAQRLAALQAPANAPAGDVSGTYERIGTGEDSAELTIARAGDGRLHVSGNALWVGNAETGNVHTGEVDGTFALEGDRLHYDADACRFTLKFAQAGLVVSEDNYACGGMNVTFDGEYEKTTPR